MRHILVLTLLSSLILPAVAPASAKATAGEQEKKAEKKTPDGKTWMTKRGELLWEENFEGGLWSKEWNRYKGDYKVVEGDKLKVAEIAADGHHPPCPASWAATTTSSSSSSSSSRARPGWASPSMTRSTSRGSS